MKITKIKPAMVAIPLAKPLATAIHRINSVCAVTLTVETDSGLVGESYMFTLGTSKLNVISEMLLSLSEVVEGEDPCFTERIWEKIWCNINFFGHKGVTIFALSVIDMACWDLKGKALGAPVYQLLGGFREQVPVYASGGLWLSQSIDELQKEAAEFVQQGFKAVKMRIGNPSVAQDCERVRAVRQAIGPDIVLMADANQGLTVDHAIRLGRHLEEFDLFWYEEPVPVYDQEGCARVKAALPGMKIASGETEYTLYGFKEMLDLRAADVLMPDLARVGGITEFVRVAHLAQANQIPISPHIFTEQSLQLMGALSNGIYLEHIPWFADLFNESIILQDGLAEVPSRPGLGFTFDDKALNKFKVS